jgi:hypothetical protein
MRKILLASCFTAVSFDALAAGLELHRVMLSAAGVGYFEYGANVDGNAALGLDVKLGQVDDVPNSLAVFDSHGAAGSIELPGRDNVRQTFDDVPFTADTLNSHAALLTSLLGEGITVAGPAAMTGRIVGAVSERVMTAPQGPPTKEVTLFYRAASVSEGVAGGRIPDPYRARTTTFGMRTTGSGSPGANFIALPQIDGAHNTFYSWSGA